MRCRPTAGVDEDSDRVVISVLVCQSDDHVGGRASQRVCISSDGMRRALHSYTEHQYTNQTVACLPVLTTNPVMCRHLRQRLTVLTEHMTTDTAAGLHPS